jgi:hypothetical protein
MFNVRTWRVVRHTRGFALGALAEGLFARRSGDRDAVASAAPASRGAAARSSAQPTESSDRPAPTQSPRSSEATRTPIARLTIMSKLTSSASRYAASSGRARRERMGARFRFWLSLSAALLAGAFVGLGLAQAERDRSEPATPTHRQEAPPAPDQERPYVQPIRIGMAPDNLITGAPALPRGPAVFWRNGDASLTEAAAFSLVSPGRRV